LVCQNISKITGPRARAIQAASIESVSLHSRRSAEPILARGPIRKKRSNRLKTGPAHSRPCT